MRKDEDRNLTAFNTIVKALDGLDSEAQQRTLNTVMTYLGIGILTNVAKTINGLQSVEKIGPFTENRSMSVKEFMREKAPNKDTERIACLAYYLTHYKDTPHFKTIDLSTLNTDAAQPKFSNAAFAVSNATRDGFLVAAIKGKKQISAAGESFVQALPDRDAARASFENARFRKRKKPKKGADK